MHLRRAFERTARRYSDVSNEPPPEDLAPEPEAAFFCEPEPAEVDGEEAGTGVGRGSERGAGLG